MRSAENMFMQKVGNAAASTIIVLALSASAGVAAPAATVSAGGMVSLSGKQQGAAITIFGLPYSPATTGEAPLRANLADPMPARAAEAPAARPITLGTMGDARRSLDYLIALRHAPIEMVLPHAIVVGGHTLKVNAAFQFSLPLSVFDLKPKGVVSKAQNEDSDDVTVRCMFMLMDVTGNSITVRVMPDPRFDAQRDVLTLNVAPDTEPLRSRVN